jgi:hypothetical protein
VFLRTQGLKVLLAMDEEADDTRRCSTTPANAFSTGDPRQPPVNVD